MNSTYKKYVTTVSLIWAACLILAFIVYVLVLSPQQASKNKMEADLSSLKHQYSYALSAAKEGVKSQLQAAIEQLRVELQDFMVLDFEDTGNLVFDLTQIANEAQISGFSISSAGSDAVKSIPNCKYLSESSLEISFTSSFIQFASFLSTLERHRPVLFVESFSISRSRLSSGSGHQANVKVAVFVKKRDGG